MKGLLGVVAWLSRKKRGTVFHIFKLRVLRITRNKKDELIYGSSTQKREADMSDLSYFRRLWVPTIPHPHSAMIENFSGFQLARKSITLQMSNMSWVDCACCRKNPLAKIRLFGECSKKLPFFFTRGKSSRREIPVNHLDKMALVGFCEIG